ncbi:CapA family protein [Streptococcus sp. sy018]|nr:CapA family protein [Streptococcus sp. sy018]
MMKKRDNVTVLLYFGILAMGVMAMVASIFVPKKESNQTNSTTQTARIVANGDILLHNVLYTSVRQPDGTYDFDDYFTYVKDWISDADLALGDFEGTISSNYPLAGYPLFNAPPEIAKTMKKVGYDVVDLAHNHILDSQLDGAIETVQTFKQEGIDSIGVYTKDRAKENILIKDVNGIKIAILGYAYGYNGMEANLTKEEYEKHLSDLDEKKMKADIEKAEKEADVTVIMPQMGEEYALKPTAEQTRLYRKMIDWGADVVFGGHPHVAEPAETIEKDGRKKFIIYSMGNFISNQTYEQLGNKWTERGLLMDVTFEKTGDETIVKTVQAHPTLVWAWGKGIYGEEGYEYFDYRVMVLEDFIKGGRYRGQLDQSMRQKVDQAYKEMNRLVNLKW